jgi:hypothetical protein
MRDLLPKANSGLSTLTRPLIGTRGTAEPSLRQTKPLIPVVLSEREEAKRLRASRRTPTMCHPPCRFKAFSPRSFGYCFCASQIGHWAAPPRGSPCGLAYSRRLCTKNKRHPAKRPGVECGTASSRTYASSRASRLRELSMSTPPYRVFGTILFSSYGTSALRKATHDQLSSKPMHQIH